VHPAFLQPRFARRPEPFVLHPSCGLFAPAGHAISAMESPMHTPETKGCTFVVECTFAKARKLSGAGRSHAHRLQRQASGSVEAAESCR
jgi:hypothetical protein